jgi:hypothetical protein
MSGPPHPVDEAEKVVDRVELEIMQMATLSASDIDDMSDRTAVLVGGRVVRHAERLENTMQAIGSDLTRDDIIKGVDLDRLERLYEQGDADGIRRVLKGW